MKREPDCPACAQPYQPGQECQQEPWAEFRDYLPLYCKCARITAAVTNRTSKTRMTEAKSKAALRTELEQARGRQIAGRAKRESDLERYKAGKKIAVMVAMPGHPLYEGRWQVNLFYLHGDQIDVNDATVGTGHIAHQNIMDDDYPSEAVMAAIAMVVNATIGTEGIPAAETIDPATRARRNQYRDQHLGLWRDK